MAKISTYGLDNNISPLDKVIGTDKNNSNLTKNFQISDIIALAGGPVLAQFDVEYEIVIPEITQLVDISIWVDENQTINVGDTNGSSEYLSVAMVVGTPEILGMGLFSIAGQSIWVTGGNGINIKYNYL